MFFFYLNYVVDPLLKNMNFLYPLSAPCFVNIIVVVKWQWIFNFHRKVSAVHTECKRKTLCNFNKFLCVWSDWLNIRRKDCTDFYFFYKFLKPPNLEDRRILWNQCLLRHTLSRGNYGQLALLHSSLSLHCLKVVHRTDAESQTCFKAVFVR